MELKPIIPVSTNINQTNYYYFKEGLDLIDVKNVENLADTYPYTKGTIVGNDEIVESIRKSKIKWLHPNDNSSWLYDQILNMLVHNQKLSSITSCLVYLQTLLHHPASNLVDEFVFVSKLFVLLNCF